MNGEILSTAIGSGTDLVSESSKVLHALDLVHNPVTKNEVRKQASEYLESLKSNDGAASYGAFLGADPGKPPLIRHYGLSLVEHTIRHKLHQQSEPQNVQVRTQVISLGKSLAENDPPFIRYKIAELWIELVKRSWALDWFDLDQYLVDFWSAGGRYRDLVLTILENLSDDIFVREDSTAILRGPDLNSCLVEIFTSPDDFVGGLKVNNEVIRLRAGEDGWLARISSLLETVSSGERQTVLKCLATLRSAMGWLMTPAIVHTNSLAKICGCLSSQDPDILIAALDCLLALYNRGRFEDADVKTLVIPLCCTENIFALLDLYRKSVVRADEMDSPRYTISKKLSEMVSYLAGLLVHTSHDHVVDQDASPFLDFMVEICQNESLIVSVPSCHAWTKILGSAKWRDSSSVAGCVGPLLQFACQRTIQYDLLGDDSDEPAILFVQNEIELSTERLGFFTNYRRLCCQIIELICYVHAPQAIPYLLSQVDAELDKLQQLDSTFNPANFVRSQISLNLDGQFSNVESAFRGFTDWRTDFIERTLEEESGHILSAVISRVQAWSNDLLLLRDFREPFAQQRTIKCAVEISNENLHEDNVYALKVLEHILKAFIPDLPQYEAYSDAVQELHLYAARELRHLAAKHADYFITFYDQFETKLRDLSTSSSPAVQVQADLSASLFLIVQRAKNIDDATRKARLWSFIEPLSLAWQDRAFQETVSTFETFSQSQYFDQVGPFLLSINASNYQNWSTVPLDVSGSQLQAAMAKRASKMPLRLTRTLLANSTDKLSPYSPMIYGMTCELWSMVLPHMVQGLLQIISYIHRLHDPSGWPNLPSDSNLMSRVLQDRFWQSGITEGSKNDFYAMIKTSKKSLEGFASSVRNKLRLNIEQCYTILHSLSKLGETFYGVPNLAEVLTQSLIETARPLSPHHYNIFLSMVSRVVSDCPASQRQIFLDFILPTLLSEVDQKCTSEWQKLQSRSVVAAEQSDDLTVEMREESLLRQLTHRAASTVALWAESSRDRLHEQQKSHHANGMVSGPSTSSAQSMSSYVLSNARVLPPLILFFTHAISYKDTKSCATVVLTLRSLVLDLAGQSPAAERLDEQTAIAIQEFLSTETLKAAITSLNDGYFAEQQHDIAALIACIWSSFGLPTHIAATETQPAHDRAPSTTAAREVLLSLPGLTEERVDAAEKQLLAVRGHRRRERAVILGLLEGFRGVSLSELGKIDTKGQKNKLVEKYIVRDSVGMQTDEDRSKQNIAPEVDLGGVADMFS